MLQLFPELLWPFLGAATIVLGGAVAAMTRYDWITYNHNCKHLGMSENGVYPQWNSHLVGIKISKTIGFRGTQHFQTHPSSFYHPKCTPQYLISATSFLRRRETTGPWSQWHSSRRHRWSRYIDRWSLQISLLPMDFDRWLGSENHGRMGEFWEHPQLSWNYIKIMKHSGRMYQLCSFPFVFTWWMIHHQKPSSHLWPNVVVVLVVLVVAVDTTDVDSLVVLLVVAGNFL